MTVAPQNSLNTISENSHSPNGFIFDGLDGPDDFRRLFVAVRRSMNAEVRSLDAMVTFYLDLNLEAGK